MRNYFISLFVLSGILFGAFSAFIARADKASSTSFVIERGVIDSGGGFSTSSGFRLNTSIGQIGTGISSSTSFVLRGGFLYLEEPAPPAPPPSPPPSPPSGPLPGGGGTGFILPPIIREEPVPAVVFEVADFNGDGRINIVDLSILLFYYRRSDAAALRFDLNRNGTVDFPDVSILMYYWTG